MRTKIFTTGTLTTSRKDIDRFLKGMEVAGVEFNISEMARVLKKHPSTIREALLKLQAQNQIEVKILIGSQIYLEKHK